LPPPNLTAVMPPDTDLDGAVGKVFGRECLCLRCHDKVDGGEAPRTNLVMVMVLVTLATRIP